MNNLFVDPYKACIRQAVCSLYYDNPSAHQSITENFIYKYLEEIPVERPKKLYQTMKIIYDKNNWRTKASFFNQVFDKEFLNIEDIITDLATVGIKSSNEYYKSFWTIKKIDTISDNKKRLFMNCFCCGTWSGWLDDDKGNLVELDSEEDLKVKYLEHVMNKHSKYYPLES